MDENTLIRTFLRNLAKGGAKSIPVVGGIIEEGLFATLDDRDADREREKLQSVLTELARQVGDTRHAVQIVLGRLLESEVRPETKDTVAKSIRDIEGDEYSALSSETVLAVKKLVARSSKSLEQAAELPHQILSLDELPARRAPFWRDVKEGLLHLADATSSAYVPEVALVCVHGLNSSPEIWRQIVETRLDETGMDIDVLAFRYRSGFVHSASVPDSAERLRIAIDGFFPHTVTNADTEQSKGPCIDRQYRHLLFFCHSNGGILTKKCLASMVDEAGTKTWSGAHRTRTVLDFDVPHKGSTWPVTVAVTYPYTMLNVLLYPFARLRSYGGMNLIPWYLRTGSPRLRDDEEATWRTRALQLDANLPPPALVNISALDGRVIRALGESGDGGRVGATYRRPRHMIGGHGSVLAEKDEADLCAKEQRRAIQQFAQLAEFSICERMIEINMREDSKKHVVDLLGGSVPNQQAAVFQAVKADLDSDAPHKHFITGDAGVGKSRTVARIARYMASKFLSAEPAATRVFPFIFQLKHLGVGPTEDIDDSIDVSGLPPLLVDLLVAYSNEVDKATGIQGRASLTWSLDMLTRRPCAIVIDDIDDFLDNSPDYTWDEVKSVLDWLADPRSGPNHRLIAAARSGQSWAASLENWQRHTIEIMTREEAIERFPHLKAALDACESDRLNEHRDAENLLRTPLVAFALGSDSRLLDTDNISPSSVMNQAVKALVRHTYAESPQEITIDDAMETLMLVAIIFYGGLDPSTRKTRSSMSIADIREAAMGLKKAWAAHLSRTEFRKHPIAAGFQLIMSDCLERLLTITCRAIELYHAEDTLRSVREPQWSFSHLYLRDFLCARYKARIAQAGFVDEIGRLGYMPHMSTLASGFMGEWCITGSFLEKCHEASGRNEDVCHIGNVFALYARNRRAFLDADAERGITAVITGRSFDDSRAVDSPPWVRTFIVNASLWHVALADDQQLALQRMLKSVTECATSPHSDLISVNQACAYLRLYLGKNTETLLDDMSEEELVECVADLARKGCSTGDLLKRRTIQTATVNLVRVVEQNFPMNVNRAIASAHYLAFLAAAYRDGYWIVESLNVVKDYYNRQSGLRRAFAAYLRDRRCPYVRRALRWVRGLTSGETKAGWLIPHKATSQESAPAERRGLSNVARTELRGESPRAQ